ncbi:MAG: hypothetical protein M3328_11720 [Chloroflexota bacterium]|nr:hypothetical protein [Chloroflexota bacterium]
MMWGTPPNPQPEIPIPKSVLLFVLLVSALLAGCDAGGPGAPAGPTATPTTALEPGAALILRLVPFDGEQAVTEDVQERARRVIEARASEMGVSGVAVRSEEPDLLIVELRGKASSEETRRALSRTGFLEIIDSGDQPLMDGTIVVTSEGGPTFEEGEPQSLKAYQAIVTGREIVPDRVAYELDPVTGQPRVKLAFNEEGTRKFADYTSASIGKYAPIVLDKRVISSPHIQAAISAGGATISGLSEAEARQLAATLRAGAMPTRLELIETQQLGTSTNP